ncbi:MAG: hypothetical protein U9N53_11375 [Bacteroidota bacterium]|nr:hypothetical protein [Bacteroidota bacterium]
MFLTVLILSVFLVGLSLAGMAIKLLVLKNGRFPVTTVGGNIHLKKKGISCPKHEELREHRNNKKGSPCTGCGFEV